MKSIVKIIPLLFILLVTSCSKELNEFSPTIKNEKNNFRITASGVDCVTESELSYTWNNEGSKAKVHQTSSITDGSGTLVVTDNNGTEVINTTIGNGDLKMDSSVGQSGTWTIKITMDAIDGDIDIKVEKK